LVLANIGHGDERINRAIMQQMEKFHYMNPVHATQVRGDLGRMISEITPGDLNKTFFTLGGAEAIENAMKIARQYTGKQKIIARYRAYHGATFASGEAGGDPRRASTEASVGWMIHMHDPYSYRSPLYRHCTPEEGDMMLCDLLEDTIRLEGPNSVAAVLLEGYSGSSGVIAPSSSKYWQRVRQICDKYNVVLICDEVMSGFGRTGKWFGINHYDIVPDIMVMAKGLTSGYLPLGAVVTNNKIAQHYEKNSFACGLTYSAHAVSCAAAIATINVYKEDKLIENSAAMGEYMFKKLSELKERHPSIGEFRGKGLHWCVELVKNQRTKEEMSEWNKPLSKPMADFASYLKTNGISTMVRWSHVYLCPPLCINKQQIDEALAIYGHALEITDAATSA
jgi:taurine--2-oxoglutarate transaminase